MGINIKEECVTLCDEAKCEIIHSPETVNKVHFAMPLICLCIASDYTNELNSSCTYDTCKRDDTHYLLITDSVLAVHYSSTTTHYFIYLLTYLLAQLLATQLFTNCLLLCALNGHLLTTHC